MTKSNIIYIKHILECINNIQEYTYNLSESDFLANKLVQDAVIRNLEIIGEASKKVSVEIKEKYRMIEWKKIAGMRDKLIHDYIGVDLWAVWAVVEQSIPQLKKDIVEVIKNES